MTKITILGSKAPEKKELKKIEFVKSITESTGWGSYCWRPNQWKFIDLICLNWRCSGYDLMRCYDDSNNGCICLGHFNDGVV